MIAQFYRASEARRGAPAPGVRFGGALIFDGRETAPDALSYGSGMLCLRTQRHGHELSGAGPPPDPFVVCSSPSLNLACWRELRNLIPSS